MPEQTGVIENALPLAYIRLSRYVDESGVEKWVADLRSAFRPKGEYCISHTAESPQRALEDVARTIREERPWR